MAAIVVSKKQRLRECEKALVEHMEEFVKVGLALKEIREERLYKEDGFETFEAYCKERWEFGKRYANHVIGSAELRLKLPGTNSSQQWKEGQVRELKRLGTPEKAKAVAGRILKEVESGNGKLTAAVVRKHVDKELGVKRGGRAEAEPPPMFEDVIYRWTGKLTSMAEAIEGVPATALRDFGRDYPERAKALADSIERLKKSMTRVWERLP